MIPAFSFSTAKDVLVCLFHCPTFEENLGMLCGKIEVEKKPGGEKAEIKGLMWPQARGWDVLWPQGVRQVTEERDLVEVLLRMSISFPLLRWNYLFVPGLLSLQQCWDWITCALVLATLLERYHVYNRTVVCVIVSCSSLLPLPSTPQAGLISVLCRAKSRVQRTASGPW